MDYTKPETEENLPNGLKELSSLSEILISRNVSLVEMFLCCAPLNASFSISTCTDPSEEFLTMRESSCCMFRDCIGAARDMSFRVYNLDDEYVARFFRGMSCFRGCCCFCGPPSMEVYSPRNINIGTIRERTTCYSPSFDVVSDRKQEPILTYSTDCCYLKTCGYFSDREIEVNDPISGACVATITKKSKSDCSELFSFKNDFIIKYLGDLDIKRKLLILGMCLLADFNNFEHDRRYCC